MIHIIGSSRYQIASLNLKDKIQEIVNSAGIPEDTALNIIFVGKRKMISIAKTYKDEPVALPVLSFLYNEPAISEISNEPPLYGEIILCYPQVVLLAAERNKRVDAMILQLVEHGVNNLLKS